MNPYQKKCEDCKWWEGKKSYKARYNYKMVITKGICKRYPKNEDKNCNDFCGEYTSVLGRK